MALTTRFLNELESAKTWILFIFSCFMLSTFCFKGIINTFFLSDDFVLLKNINEFGPFGIWTIKNSSWIFFRPLISLSIFLDHKIWSLNPFGFHITNIVFHTINSILLSILTFLILKHLKIPEKGRYFISYASGYIFLVLCTHTESVSWISGRTDIIATFFFLASLCTFLQSEKMTGAYYKILSVLFFTFALLSKETAVTLPLIILLMDFYLFKSKDKKNLIKKMMPYLLILLIYLFVRSYLINNPTDYLFTRFNIKILFKILIIFPSRIFIPPLGKFFIGNFGIPLNAILFLIFIVLFFLLILKKRATIIPKEIYLIGVIFLISMIPTMMLSVSSTDTQGERFLYLPSAFFVILLTLMLYNICNLKYFVIVIFIVLIFHYVHLKNCNKNWILAGQISNRITTEIASLLKEKPIIIINLPDSINGAFIFRNGISEAIELCCFPKKIPEVCIIITHELKDLSDLIIVTKEENTIHAVLNKNSILTREDDLKNNPISKEFSYKSQDFNECHINFNSELIFEKNLFLYFSKGNIHQLK